jgi:multimeric flavodoxin WrbA/protein-tyrosine-phosphatase
LAKENMAMLVLGLQGSPRKKGNTHALLSMFLEEAGRLGARTQMVYVAGRNIIPCKELVVCEKKGFCPLEDDMQRELYALIREADVLLLASPVFFYGVTAQLKALIDRCQTLWARKYRLKLKDPRAGFRRGFFLSVGATAGRNLFEGLKLTAQYFFDAVDARFHGSLTYNRIEGARDMATHPTVHRDVKEVARNLLEPLANRKKMIFIGRGNACRSQMAAAFARRHAGDRFDVATGGSRPAEAFNPLMVESMQEKGIDMAFQRPRSIAEALQEGLPDWIVDMGSGEKEAAAACAVVRQWDVPDPVDSSPEAMRSLRDRIEQEVATLVGDEVS